MPLFNRLFGKKTTTQAAAIPEAVPEQQPEIKPNAGVIESAPKPTPQKLDPPNSEPSAPMPTIPIVPWRTFSIFISSTFADMQAERDHLKHVVFPLVEEELQKRRIKLEIVDLRWGVDTTSMAQEDEREASVLKVCLDKIRRCRPFFIGLLGDRYGWVPPLERMKTALLGEKHINPEKGKSVTDLEIEFGVLASQEQLVRSVFYFREPLPYATFSKKKAVLFSDEYNDELSEAEKKERKIALIKLKAKIVAHFTANKLENKVKIYTGIWNVEKEKLTGLESWGETVYTDILAECESHAKDTWNKVPQNWQEQEMALLNDFIENNTTTFCGRKPLLETLKQHLLSGDSANWGLVLTGESGSGKSAVFSMVTKMMQERKDCFILANSAGLSPRAKSVADLLRIWNKQLAEHLGIKEEFTDFTKTTDDPAFRLTGEQGKETTTPIEKLQEKFLGLLQMASAKKRVVLLIDTLDRFEPTARAQHMSWLPSLMPQNVRMLCTAITETEKKAVQYHKGLTTKNLDVFSAPEAKEMLDALCLKQHKSLPAKIEKIILDKKRTDGQPATVSPLWLSLAVNMLMAIDHDDFEKMSQLEGRGDQQIESYMVAMANGFDPLPGPLFLSLKNKAGILFGNSFTTAIFNYIAISRNGLREKDLEKILPNTSIAWDSLKFANLRRWFKAHLVLQGEELQWNLAHSILKSAITQQIEEPQRLKLHETIAGYLIPLHNDPLKATETIYHLINASNYKEAALYYSSDLTYEEAAGATTVLAEIVTVDEKGLVLVSTMPGLVVNEFKNFHRILRRFIDELNDALEVEGNLTGRLVLLEKIEGDLRKTYVNNISNDVFGYNTAVIYVKLGDIHQLMGHLEEALNYFDVAVRLNKELYEANLQSESLKNGFAISYSKLGDIHQSMGHLEEALKYFDVVVRLFKELYEANPRSESLKNSLAISYEKLGYIHQLSGQMEEALRYFEKRFVLSKELHEANPRDIYLLEVFSISYEKLGDIHQLMGHMEEALKYFDDAVRLFKKLYEAKPQSESLKKGLAISYEKLGDIHQAMGHTKEALKYFDDEFKLMKELYEANPRNESLKNGIAISYGKLGDIHQLMGHTKEALKYLEMRSVLGKELYDANPRNESLKNGLAISFEKLGSMHLSMGHTKEALKYFENDLKLTKELYEANSCNESLKIGIAISYQFLGNIHQSMGYTEKALKYFENSNHFSRELYEANPLNINLLEGLCISYSKLGSIHQSMGHMEEALNYFENDLELTKKLYEANPRIESLKKGLSISFEKLGSIHQSMGHTKEALKYFENDLKLTKELFEANPQSEKLKNGLAISFEKLGDILQSMGHTKEALKYFDDEVRLFKELNEANPQSETLKHGLAISYQYLGNIHQSMCHMEEALKYFENYNQISKELYDSNPHNESLKNGLAISYQHLGNIHQSIGHLEESLKWFENYNQLSIELHEANPRNESLKKSLAISYSKLGDIHQSMGRLKESFKYFENYNQLSKELYEANPKNINFLEELGISNYQIAIINGLLGNHSSGKYNFNIGKEIFSFLTTNVPQIKKYKELNSFEYEVLVRDAAENLPISHEIITDINTDVSTTKEYIEPNPLIELIQSGEFEQTLHLLVEQEAKIRKKLNNAGEFQSNVGEQAYVLSKLGRYQEALQRYEIQAESFARTQMYEAYADCLLSQAELLIDFLGNPKKAKNLLEEAIAIAKENKLSPIIREAESMLKEIK